MEVTILDTDDNRYDPDVVNVIEEPGRVFLVVQHDGSISLSPGDRAQLFLASDGHERGELSDIVRKRKAMQTVGGVCVKQFADDTYCWEIDDVSAVDEILDSEDSISLSDFA